jgi:hypothetical protein
MQFTSNYYENQVKPTSRILCKFLKLLLLVAYTTIIHSVDISDSKLSPDFVIKVFIDIIVDEVTK